MKPTEEGLIRTIGVWGLTANIVNVIVGAGIFVLPAIVAQTMGSTSVVAYFFCGILITLVMLCFAEAGSKVTNSGGGYSYVETAFGKFAGFLCGIILFMGNFLADAVVANALVDLAGAAFPIFKVEWMRFLFLFVFFYGLAFVNILGVKEGIGLVKISTLVKLTPLFLLILIGWKDVSLANLVWDHAPKLGQLGATSLVLFFAFQGAEVGLQVGGEILNPKRTIPRAIFVSIAIVLLFYMLIQTVSQGILGNNLAHFTEAPLAETGRVIFGSWGYTFLLAGAAISMFGFLSGSILNNPRLVFALGRDRVIPVKMLGAVHKKLQTPYVAILVYASFGFVFAVLGGFQQLITAATASVLILYLGVALSVIKLRKMYKTQPGEFKIPGGLTVPILSVIVILYFLSNLTYREQIATAIILVVLAALYGLIAIYNKRKSTP